jgi:hypothetical protein
MGAFHPVYSPQELGELTDANRKKLRAAIVRHLETHPQIRKILRQKTQPLYDRLKRKKRKAPRRRRP